VGTSGFVRVPKRFSLPPRGLSGSVAFAGATAGLVAGADVEDFTGTLDVDFTGTEEVAGVVDLTGA